MTINQVIEKYQHILEEPKDLEKLVDQAADKRVVMLGDASHGTSEYYTGRSAISKQLILNGDISFVAVEGDWPDCYRINRYIKGYADAGASAHQVLLEFTRWPTWLWANQEMLEFIEWLRAYNDRVDKEEEKIGFYGIDVYGLWESLDIVITYLQERVPESVDAVYAAFKCFQPYARDAQRYAHATALVPTSCEDQVLTLLTELRSAGFMYQASDREAYFNAEQNAVVAKNAEHYYRTMLRGDEVSWNVRDHHMAQVLDNLLTFHGPKSKALVWEHNTHIGDARYTDMVRDGMVNVGQLARERYGQENVYLIGLGAYSGTLIAAEAWGLPPREMRMPDSLWASWEAQFHEVGEYDRFILMSEVKDHLSFQQWRGQRAVGVVYNPRREIGNYVPTILGKRYDAYVYIDRSQALEPLYVEAEPEYTPETFPTGV
ncbi:MAG TPA: erythromycin esterase family protein [Patescibacteria group bacterium]